MVEFGKRVMPRDDAATATSTDQQPTARRGLRRRLGFARSAGSRSPSPRASESSADELAMLEESPQTSAKHIVFSPSPQRHVAQQPSMSPSESKRRTSASSEASAASSSSSCQSADKSTLSLSRKGVKYGPDGSVVCCRFCEILRSGDADFVYEDDEIAVFRPLSPVVASHVLVVPRCHIRNINVLTHQHADLLKRMREVAELVLLRSGAGSRQSIECKFAFHKPPFNSIDHVHMHAFRKSGSTFGCLGSIKYRTETWWCRSFEEVLSRVGSTSPTTSMHTVRPSEFSVGSPLGSYVTSR